MISFHHPLLLVGAVAAVLPLLIYFFTRDRVAIVPFSTLRFFAGNSAKLVRRKRWLETLLLAMRMLLVALIAFAFARPFFQKKAAAGADGKTRLDDAVVLLIDVSQSMSRPGVWKQALDKADAAVGSAAVSVVAFDQAPQVLTTWADAGATRDKLRLLEPQAAGTDLVAALRKANELLVDVAAENKRVVLVSDLQRAGLPPTAASFKLSPGVGLQVEAVTSESPQKVAIVEANLPQSLVADNNPQPITLRLANFTAEPISNVTIDLALANQPVQTQTLTLPPNQRLTASFRATLRDGGDHAGTITLKTPDGQGIVYLNPFVLPRIGVTILTNPEDVARPGSSAFFLSKAISPGDGSPFEVKVQSGASPVDLKDTSVLILADLTEVSPALKQQIADFHKDGGGVLLLPGSKTEPAKFAADFGSIAPAQLRRIIKASDTRKGDAKALITRVELDHAILNVFQRPHSGNFSAVAFNQYWEVTDSQLSRVPLRLDDGRPFMLERGGQAGGAVVMLVSPPDMAWNNLPQRAIYLPLLHQTLRYLAIRAETPTTYQVGDVLQIPPGLKVRDPSGQTHAGSSIIASAPGHYVLLDQADKPAITYAVNTPLAEGDATTIPVEELKAAFANADTAGASEGGSLVAAGSRGRELWSIIIAFALVLVVTELFVSNRVPRH